VAESEAAATEDSTATELLRESLSGRVTRIEEELALMDRQHRHLSTRIEECRERAEQAETIKTLLVSNLSRYPGEEVERAIEEQTEAVSELAVAEQRYEELTDRRAEARERLGWLRHDLDLAVEATRDADVRSPDEEATTFRDASRQVFQIIEEERMRIARDMHDGPAQSMSNLVLQAEILERLVDRDPQQLVTELQDFKSSVRNALDETRQLIFDLRPMTLDDLGLVPTLRKYIKEYGDKYGFTTHFNVIGEERRLTKHLEGTLFRIIQEALTNVNKHARAKTSEVTLNLSKDRIQASIRDDGAGFDVTATEANLARNHNLGLISMRERAELEHGSLEIKSRPGKGTEIRVELRQARS
jgi:two-component system sensor histidine kinase DegS